MSSVLPVSISPPDQLAVYAQRVEAVLERELPQANEYNQTLAQAMRHATLLGGKRVRASLVYAFAEAFGTTLTSVDSVAAAIECIHAYSLVHDDLPCMDDDTMRRGQPTVHTKWDEATAVLTGDALQTLAFSLISQNEYLGADSKIKMIESLSTASGVNGMVGGQMLDLENYPDVAELHGRKTGALIIAACELGAIAGNATEEELANTRSYGQYLGLLFQIVDDILDVTVESSTLGKTSGKDAEQEKTTYVRMLGLDGAREKAHSIYEKVLQCLPLIQKNSAFLEELTRFVYKRTS